MKKTRPLPPIIQDWIVKLSDKNTSIHIRNNYREMLEHVISQSQEAVEKFNRDKN